MRQIDKYIGLQLYPYLYSKLLYSKLIIPYLRNDFQAMYTVVGIVIQILHTG